MKFTDLFTTQKPIIGMVHLRPLPGSPHFDGNLPEIYAQAQWEAQTLAEAGVDGLIVENLGDEPYQIGEPTPVQFALMAAITRQVRQNIAIPVGLNVQFNAWQAEMAIAHACEADFVRVEVFVDTVVSAQGIVHPCSAQITRYRKELGARVALFADIQTKYTTNIISQPLTQSAIDARNAGADALIVTGAATGAITPLNAVTEVKSAVNLPVLVGSGTNIQNVAQVLAIADGAIVGSALKEDRNAENHISSVETQAFMAAAQKAR
ncbi:MAG: BtpA/SgcQ family protein [Anaerolineaceae bacterium]|jgi:membrane complex biogenesis BtpA family protein|nr:BtpA/SgcQ family protein [Anaerolineaceae bacterium]